jgi:hypothetical protein
VFRWIVLVGLMACTGTSVKDPVDTDVVDSDSDSIDTELVDTEVPDTDVVDTDETDDTQVIDTDDGTYIAVPGAVCDLADRIGRISLTGYGGALNLSGRVHDRANPWMGAPALSTSTCDFHQFVPGACGVCPTGEVCGVSGGCVPEQRSLKDLTVTVTSDGRSEVFTANAVTGDLSGSVTVGGPGDLLALEIEGAQFAITLVPMLAPDGELTGVSVLAEGDYDSPGALTASWTPTSDDSFVGSLIPINHHASGPTFTSCLAPGSSGQFAADADMVNPLAIITGLEFQGLEHVSVAAATTPAGCVEVWMGTQVFQSVSFP